MTIAAPTSRLPQRFVFYDVDWDFYDAVLKRVSGRHVFATYDRGTLEIMSPSYLHDRVARLLYLLIHTLAQELGIPISSAGTTTWRRKRLGAGLEADEAFYLRNEPRIRGKKKINLRQDPPPDLAVEVEVSRRMGKRTKVYSRLGIPEVWRYRPGRLTVTVLQEDGSYLPEERSPTFPADDPADLARFVEQGLASNESEWVRKFREWVQTSVKSGRDNSGR